MPYLSKSHSAIVSCTMLGNARGRAKSIENVVPDLPFSFDSDTLATMLGHIRIIGLVNFYSEGIRACFDRSFVHRLFCNIVQI